MRPAVIFLSNKCECKAIHAHILSEASKSIVPFPKGRAYKQLDYRWLLYMGYFATIWEININWAVDLPTARYHYHSKFRSLCEVIKKSMLAPMIASCIAANLKTWMPVQCAQLCSTSVQTQLHQQKIIAIHNLLSRLCGIFLLFHIWSGCLQIWGQPSQGGGMPKSDS
jgi:hypothetical protein